MTDGQKTLAFDARLSEEARILGLHLSEVADDEHGVEMPHDELAALLHGCPNRDTVGRHMRQLLIHRYVERTNRGGSGSPRYRWIYGRENSRVEKGAAREKSRVEPTLPAKIHDQERPLHTTGLTTIDPPIVPPEEFPGLEALVEYVGREPVAVAVESKVLPKIKLQGLWAMYRPGGTQGDRFFSGVPPDDRARILGTAITRMALDGKEYNNRLFEGYLKRARDGKSDGNGTGHHQPRSDQRASQGPPRRSFRSADYGIEG